MLSLTSLLKYSIIAGGIFTVITILIPEISFFIATSPIAALFFGMSSTQALLALWGISSLALLAFACAPVAIGLLCKGLYELYRLGCRCVSYYTSEEFNLDKSIVDMNQTVIDDCWPDGPDPFIEAFKERLKQNDKFNEPLVVSQDKGISKSAFFESNSINLENNEDPPTFNDKKNKSCVIVIC